MGAGAATVLDTELTTAGIPHDLKGNPRAKHAFFNDQWREQACPTTTDGSGRPEPCYGTEVTLAACPEADPCLPQRRTPRYARAMT